MLILGGELYRIAHQVHKTLKDGSSYKFPQHDEVVCRYSKQKDRLFYAFNTNQLKCKQCGANKLRTLLKNGKCLYQNGDLTKTVSLFKYVV